MNYLVAAKLSRFNQAGRIDKRSELLVIYDAEVNTTYCYHKKSKKMKEFSCDPETFHDWKPIAPRE